MIDNTVNRRVPKRKNPLAFFKYLPAILILVILGLFFFLQRSGVQEQYAFIIFLLIIIPITLLVGMIENDRWKESWQDFAKRAGYSYEEYKVGIGKWARIKGHYHEFPLRIEKFARGSGRYKRFYTSIVVGLKEPSDEALEIKSRSLLSGAGKFFSGKKGLKPVDIGDMELDGKLVFRSTSDPFARRVLSSVRVRQALLEIDEQTQRMVITVKGNIVSYQELGVVVDPAYLYALVKTLAEIAHNAGGVR